MDRRFTRPTCARNVIPCERAGFHARRESDSMPLSRGFAAEACEVGVSILYQGGTFASGPPSFSDGVMLARRRARGCLDAAERSRRRRGGVASAERSRRRRGGVALTPRRGRADAADSEQPQPRGCHRGATNLSHGPLRAACKRTGRTRPRKAVKRANVPRAVRDGSRDPPT